MATQSTISATMKFCAVLAALSALSACGGGGSNSGRMISAPPPVPPPPPAPPPPPPATNFNTAEYRRSDGPVFHDAISAWQAGITGEGRTIAIIDTGIDIDSPEFAGRIHPDSADLAGNGTFDAADQHGTNVALVAGAARNGTGVVGIAFSASLLALRADRPGSCNVESDDPLEGCQFSDRDIASGVDQAIRSGASVINISLGGSAPTVTLQNAVARAAEAGIVIVVSAGNEGDSTDAGSDPARPDPFPAGLLEAGGKNVIIVGSIDDNGIISDFSNRAGDLGASYITARGERICCEYVNGELEVTTDANGQQFVTVFSGTSFSAPQVAGAVALLAQAFPNLTGAEIVEILLGSARDAGAAGIDAIYGSGILDIAAATRPRGTTSLAGTDIRVALGSVGSTASAAMGDALDNASLRTVVTDRYDRAYDVDLATGFRSAAKGLKLHGVIDRRTQRIGGGNGKIAMGFTIGRDADEPALRPLQLSVEEAKQARVLAGQIAVRLAPDTQVAFGFAQSEHGLVGQLQGQDKPAFLIATAADGDGGFAKRDAGAFAVRREVGDGGLTFSASQGEALVSGEFDRGRFGARAESRYDFENFGVAADYRIGAMELALGGTFMREVATVLGAKFDPVLGVAGGETLFLDGRVGWQLPGNWRLGAAYRHGRTFANGSGVGGGSRFDSQAFAFDLTRSDVFRYGDRLGLRVSQPLRVSSGGLDLSLPIAYDYATESAVFGTRRLSLTPSGREIDTELAWTGNLWGGNAAASVFYRRQPGHFIGNANGLSPDDTGLVFHWGKGF